MLKFNWERVGSCVYILKLIKEHEETNKKGKKSIKSEVLNSLKFLDHVGEQGRVIGGNLKGYYVLMADEEEVALCLHEDEYSLVEAMRECESYICHLYIDKYERLLKEAEELAPMARQCSELDSEVHWERRIRQDVFDEINFW